MRSTALLWPVLISQAHGFAGTPAAAHCPPAGGKGSLPSLFGQIEIAEQADQGCQNPTRLSAKDLCDDLVHQACSHTRIQARASATSSLERPDRPHFDAAMLGAGDARRDGGGF